MKEITYHCDQCGRAGRQFAPGWIGVRIFGMNGGKYSFCSWACLKAWLSNHHQRGGNDGSIGSKFDSQGRTSATS